MIPRSEAEEFLQKRIVAAMSMTDEAPLSIYLSPRLRGGLLCSYSPCLLPGGPAIQGLGWTRDEKDPIEQGHRTVVWCAQSKELWDTLVVRGLVQASQCVASLITETFRLDGIIEDDFVSPIQYSAQVTTVGSRGGVGF